MKQLIIDSLSKNKAENIICFDVKGKYSLADNIIIATATSNRHIKALTEYLIKDLKQAERKNLHIEGEQDSDWVLIDTGDEIVHIISAEMREFYNLEEIWQNIGIKSSYE